MFSIEDYERLGSIGNDDAIIGGDRTLPGGSTTDALNSLGHTLNFIYSWLQPLKHNYYQKTMTNR